MSPATTTPEPALTRTAVRPAGSRRWAVFLGVAAVFALFGAGLVELFQLRFAAGDVYPPYSTLRSDPLGAAAFYQALATQPGLRVRRNLRPLARLDKKTVLSLGGGNSGTAGGTDASAPTCFYLGADPYEWPREMDKPGVERLEEILRAGGRVVLTFQPAKTLLTAARLQHSREEEEADDLPRPKASPSPSGSPEKKDPRAERLRRAMAQVRPPDLIERWGIDFQREKPGDGGKQRFSLAKLLAPAGATPPPTPPPTPTPAPSVSLAKGRTALPVPGGEFDGVPVTSWHTVLSFDVDTPEARAAGWHPLLVADGQPVVVARPYGVRGGELVLASDSYFLSNEALRVEPRPALLAALVGDGQRVLFDENHFGVRENPGLMTLARRYGLQGGLAAVGLLVALFLWRNVVSLVPPTPPPASALEAGTVVLGRDSATGFLNLIRRGVPPRDLPGVCLEQWRHGPGVSVRNEATVARLRAAGESEAARPARERTPAAAYRAMCAALRPQRYGRSADTSHRL